MACGSALGPYSFTLSLGGKANDELQNFNHNLCVLGALPLMVLLLSPLASKPIKSDQVELGAYELVGANNGELELGGLDDNDT